MIRLIMMPRKSPPTEHNYRLIILKKMKKFHNTFFSIEESGKKEISGDVRGREVYVGIWGKRSIFGGIGVR